MTYPVVPPGNAPLPSRVRLDAARYWSGAGATAIVAALIALVGILISRWTLRIPILAPAADGAWGNAHTTEYVLVAVVITAIAATLLYLLVLAAPQPRVFFGWIMALATLASVVYPFSTTAQLDEKIATAVVNAVLGIAITSLLGVSAALAAHPPELPRVRRTINYVPDPRYPFDRRHGIDPRHAPGYETPQLPPSPGYETQQPGPGPGYEAQQPLYETPQPRFAPRYETQQTRSGPGYQAQQPRPAPGYQTQQTRPSPGYQTQQPRPTNVPLDSDQRRWN